MTEKSTENDARVLATPIRPYRDGTPLVAVSESAWEDAQSAETQVPELEDALANANAYAISLEQRLAAIRDLHAGKHVCTTGDGRGWFMWGAKETCTTARLIGDLGSPTPTPGDLS